MLNFKLKFGSLHFCNRTVFHVTAPLFATSIPFLPHIAFGLSVPLMSEYPVMSSSDVDMLVCYIQKEDGKILDLDTLCGSTLVGFSPNGFIPKPLTQAELARRLRVEKISISRKQFEPDFVMWTRTLDPARIGWQYLIQTDRFYPVPVP